MKKKLTTITLNLAMTAALGGLLSCATGENSPSTRSDGGHAAHQQNSEHSATPPPNNVVEMAEHTQAAPGNPVPAHYQDALSVGSLGPVLAPEQFSGKVRLAYQAAREIPVTLAQLPCYCHCDRSIGHKSLHSCFEDTHAAQCGICMDEALLAYRLQKEQKMSPAEIRQTIIQNYQAH